jgi:hypothetical protein
MDSEEKYMLLKYVKEPTTLTQTEKGLYKRWLALLFLKKTCQMNK